MEANFFIKYRGVNEQSESEVDLVALGESIIGFDSVIKEIFDISKIKGNIQVNATKTRKGSIIIDVLIYLSNVAGNIPFKNITDFLDFLRVVDPAHFKEASDFFSTLGRHHATINDFATKYPVDYDIIKSLPWFIWLMIYKARNHKSAPDAQDLPKKYAIALHKMIKTGKFKKALKPFVENAVSKIEVSNDKDFRSDTKSVIDVTNFENYLSNDEQILPEYENGKTYKFVGTVVSMQCIRGDSMKIRIRGLKKQFRDLVVFPPKGKTTKDFDEFYGQPVNFDALVERKSLYQKPQLHIQSMGLEQETLF